MFLVICYNLMIMRYQLDGPTRLKFKLDSTNHEARIHEIDALLRQLM